jgi:uncharacterized protein YjiS (DUF1127 family)
MDTILGKAGTIGSDGGRPAFPIQTVIALFERVSARLDTYRELQQLSEMDERMLRDIGVRREDVARAQRRLFRPGREQ